MERFVKENQSCSASRQGHGIRVRRNTGSPLPGKPERGCRERGARRGGI